MGLTFEVSHDVFPASDLPNEIFIEIVCFLDVASIFRFSSTCHRFKELIFSPENEKILFDLIHVGVSPETLSHLRVIYPHATPPVLLRLTRGCCFRRSETTPQVEKELVINLSGLERRRPTFETMKRFHDVEEAFAFLHEPGLYVVRNHHDLEVYSEAITLKVVLWESDYFHNRGDSSSLKATLDEIIVSTFESFRRHSDYPSLPSRTASEGARKRCVSGEDFPQYVDRDLRAFNSIGGIVLVKPLGLIYRFRHAGNMTQQELADFEDTIGIDRFETNAWMSASLGEDYDSLCDRATRKRIRRMEWKMLLKGKRMSRRWKRKKIRERMVRW